LLHPLSPGRARPPVSFAGESLEAVTGLKACSAREFLAGHGSLARRLESLDPHRTIPGTHHRRTGEWKFDNLARSSFLS
jgi:hypothetical protein